MKRFFVLALIASTSVVAQTANSTKVDGKVRTWNAPSRVFVLRDEDDGRVRSITVRVNAQTRYQVDDNRPISAAQFWRSNRIGQEIDVRGTQKGSTITASLIDLEN
jgi:hypothetical protein